MKTLIDILPDTVTDDMIAEDELLSLITSETYTEVNNCSGCDNTRTYGCATGGGKPNLDNPVGG